MMNVKKSSGIVLVVDDSPEALSLINDTLEAAGYDVLVALEGNQALTIVNRIRPDIILLDALMPGITGFEVCRRVRADKKFDDMRIVMASAKAYEADRNKAKKMGADGYIVKPFTMKKFDAIVQSLGSMKLSAWGVRGTLPMPGKDG